MVRMRVLLALSVVAAMTGVALGNGRPPATVGVFTRPGDNQAVYVSTTFGFLISHDDGCSFRWICEKNVGYGGTFDPKYAIAHDGTIYATTFDGLRISRDDGCSFITAAAKASPSLDGVWVDALDLGPDDDVWIGTAESGGANDVYHSTDAGRTFTAMGLRSATVWWKSVRIAQSNPQRVYVSGYQVAGGHPDLQGLPPARKPGTPEAFVFRTDDAGAHWIARNLESMQFATTPVVMIEAVDPDNPDVVFARSQGGNRPLGDRLYRSENGGETWAEVLLTTDAIHKVLFTHDHRILVATITSGVFASTDNGRSFQPLPAQPQMACLTERSDGTLFACGSNWEPDFMALARSSDATTWTKTYRFSETAGPLACPQKSVQYERCELVDWPVLREQFGAVAPVCASNQPDAPGPGPGDGGCCDASGGGPTSALLALGLYVMVGRRRGRTRAA